MTKVFALLSVAAVLAFASCAEKTNDAAANDTTAAAVPADTVTKVEVKADSTADSSATAPTTAPAEAPKAH